MKETDDAGCRSIMNEARKMARNTMETIEKSNHEMGEQVKHDIQALEDEVEHYLKIKNMNIHLHYGEDTNICNQNKIIKGK